jgi:hypothetical protein
VPRTRPSAKAGRIGSRPAAGLDGEARLVFAREQPHRVESRLGPERREEGRAVLRAPQRLRSDCHDDRCTRVASGLGELAHHTAGQLGPRRVQAAAGEDAAAEPGDAGALENDAIAPLENQQQHGIRAEIDHAHARLVRGVKTLHQVSCALETVSGTRRA